MSLSDQEIMEELESWKGFGDALKAEDRELFTEMLRQCYEYIPSMHAKASPFTAEALLMSILFAQHKRIAQSDQGDRGAQEEDDEGGVAGDARVDTRPLHREPREDGGVDEARGRRDEEARRQVGALHLRRL